MGFAAGTVVKVCTTTACDDQLELLQYPHLSTKTLVFGKTFILLSSDGVQGAQEDSTSGGW